MGKSPQGSEHRPMRESFHLMMPVGFCSCILSVLQYISGIEVKSDNTFFSP